MASGLLVVEVIAWLAPWIVAGTPWVLALLLVTVARRLRLAWWLAASLAVTGVLTWLTRVGRARTSSKTAATAVAGIAAAIASAVAATCRAASATTVGAAFTAASAGVSTTSATRGL